jgi:hypothetical protein
MNIVSLNEKTERWGPELKIIANKSPLTICDLSADFRLVFHMLVLLLLAKYFH